MESDIIHTGQMYSLLGWLDKNRRQILSGIVAVIIIGIIVAFVVWRKGEQEAAAGEALSAALMPVNPTAAVSSSALLKVATDHAGTVAGARALLVAAGELFAEGKAAEAQMQFERYRTEYSESPLVAQANLGLAASLAAQGKTNEAVTAFKSVADRNRSGTASAAKLSLARIYEAQGKLEAARDLYLDLVRDPAEMVRSEAGAHLGELFQQHPSLRPAVPGSVTNAVSVGAEVPARP